MEVASPVRPGRRAFRARDELQRRGVGTNRDRLAASVVPGSRTAPDTQRPEPAAEGAPGSAS
ncbi:hypothetical protein AQJ67_18925 [Streptomyces caeruleatus]|uniref:Uncharacterized protein n=1 Tax=Streptomyces caeruleatus TaxID=661399 RepID=A0A101U1C3_9ACTN|nr:hypothetical protein AQJ67_18925 [Streptomyces caeruleatus]